MIKEYGKMYRLVLYESKGRNDNWLISKNFYGDATTGEKLKATILKAIESIEEVDT